MQEKAIDLKEKGPLIYVCPYFPHDRWEAEKLGYYRFEVDWKDLKFRDLIKPMISPRSSKLKLLNPPKEAINIAMHYREGGGVDAECVRLQLPMKLPPLSFYQEALKKVRSLKHF